jgi:hypothetical protein
MGMNEAAFDSGMVDEPGSNGNGQSNTLQQREDSYQAAYDAGLASGREAAYREGYQAGFADGFKQTLGSDRAPASAAAKTKTADDLVQRLKGLPCPHCGISSFTDETHCPCCRTP